MTPPTRPQPPPMTTTKARLLAEFDGSVCPACHHRAHDPGGCSDCPRCELHTDEAAAFVLRYEPELLDAADAEPVDLRAAVESCITEWGGLSESTSDGTLVGTIPADGTRLEACLRAALATAVAESPAEAERTASVGYDHSGPIVDGLTVEPADPDHEHYWVDAHDDETGWHCTICGVTEYPGGYLFGEDS